MPTGNREFGLTDILGEHRHGRPHETAIVDGDLRLTYAALGDRVDRLIAGLARRGVGKGDRIAWLGRNSFRILELTLAAGGLGAMLCPINWRQSAEEVDFVLRDLQPAVLVVQDQAHPAPAGPTPLPVQLWVRAGGPDDDYERLLAARKLYASDGSPEPTDSLVVMYTAAHDGRPNGALLSNRGLHAAGILHGIMNGVFDERPTFLASGPLYHVATFMGMVSTFLAGGTNVFLPKHDAAAACRLVESEGCTWTYLTGPAIGEVAAYNAVAGHDLSTLFIPPAYVRADSRWANMGRPSRAPWARYPGGFGQTEATGVLTYTALAVGAAGSAGRASPYCQIRVVDPDDREVPRGETGEITARGPILGNGYWNRPELNDQRWRNDWWHTSDLGRREEDGSLTFVGPKTRMIKSAKENVYPAEVERCLLSHPDIEDAAVIGVADEAWEQSVKALVVRSPMSTLTAADIILHCKERIASYKKPRFVEFVDSLPRNGGALDRDELDRQHGGSGYVGDG